LREALGQLGQGGVGIVELQASQDLSALGGDPSRKPTTMRARGGGTCLTRQRQPVLHGAWGQLEKFGQLAHRALATLVRGEHALA
jgi:hypothetical protein